MRTDAKIGFAIAGVLVAVVVVYFVVIPRHGRQAKVTQAAPDATVHLVPPPPPDVTVPPTNNSDAPPPVVSPAAPKPVEPAPASGPLVSGNSGGAQPPLPDDVVSPPLPNLIPTDNKHKAKPASGSGLARGASDDAAGHSSKRHRGSASPDDGSRAAVVAVAGQRTYIVRPGQTLTSIASDLYGDPHAWTLIQKANPKLNPSRLRVGAKILIPDPSAIRPRPAVVVPAAQVILADDAADVAAAAAPGQTYRVKNGDTLYTIAKRILGSGSRADALFDLNRDVIGSNPSRLKLGMLLRLPSAGVLSDAAN